MAISWEPRLSSRRSGSSTWSEKQNCKLVLRIRTPKTPLSANNQAYLKDKSSASQSLPAGESGILLRFHRSLRSKQTGGSDDPDKRRSPPRRLHRLGGYD